MILSKNNIFDLQVKGQGPTKVIMVCDTPPYGHAYTNYLFMKFCWIYLNLRSKVKVPRRSLRYVTHRLIVMHPHTKEILFKKQLFDLEVKDQGPTKFIAVRDIPPYMVMHPHTKYH